MQCKQCNYRLWNLTSRHCPECNATFTPSDYHFKPNRVEFCCPHCMHPYLGNDAHGHLDPVDFDCTQCGKYIHMNDMLLRPVNPKEEASLACDPNPWTLRPRAHLITAWLRTLHKSTFHSRQLMEGTPTQGGTLDALTFASSNILIACLGGVGLPLLLMTAITFMTASAGSIIANVLYLLVFIAIMLGGLVIDALLIHGLLKITGGTRHNLACTFKAMAYTTGPLIFLAFPCFNIALLIPMLMWYYVGSSNALIRMQEVHPVRALLSQLVLPTLVVGLWVRLVIL